MSSTGNHADSDLPAVDERLVAPESGYEIDDGKLVRVVPAHEPHANLHSKLSALLEAHVGEDFDVAVDMLTRTSEIDDIAPDASVYPKARDPRTGGRQLEHLAFEIVSTETVGNAGRKAAKLRGRGVRRVFAIDVERVRVLEWSSELGTWAMLEVGSSIEDPALAVPLPVDALARAAKTDDAVAKALLAKQNPVLVAAVSKGRAEGWAEGRAEGCAEGRAEGLADGLARGRAETILLVLARRGLQPTPEQREQILRERDTAKLDSWLERALTCSSIVELWSIVSEDERA